MKRKMRRRVGGIVLASTMLISTIPTTALAADESSVDLVDINPSGNDADTLVVTNVNEATTNNTLDAADVNGEPDTRDADSTNWIELADTTWYNENDATFTIDTAEELAGLAKLVNEGNDFSKKTIKLGANIDLDGKEWTPIGTSSSPFGGTLDGGNNTISNFTVIGTGYLGLFGKTNGATVKDLTLSDVSVTGTSDRVGTLAGQTVGTTLSNVTISGAIVTSTVFSYGNAYAGGLTGEGYTGKIENCVVDDLTLITNGAFVGGISGQGYAAINNCIVKNSSISTEYWKIGGIIGQLNEGKFTFEGNQVLDTTIASTSASGSVGGIIGFSNYGSKTLTDNIVKGVTLSSPTGAGGLIGSVSSQNNDNFSFNKCTVDNLTFQSEGTITNSGGLIGEKYWRGSEGTTFSAENCTVSDIQVDAADDSKVGALFGAFGTDDNTYTVTDVTVTAGDSESAVSQLIGNPKLGNSTFTMSGNNTKIDTTYAGEAVDYLAADTVLKPNSDGTYGVADAHDEVAFNKNQITYYTSLQEAFAGANSGDFIVAMADDSSAAATLNTSVTLDPGSYTLPDITVAEGANLTISGSDTLNSNLINNGTVTVDQDTTVTSYTGSGILNTNQTGKRVKWMEDEKKLVLYNIPYMFEVNGIKYEDMNDAAEAIGASWNADTQTLTLEQNISITGTIGILSSMECMTLDLGGFQLDWPENSNADGYPLIATEPGTTLTVLDSSANQTGRLVAGKSNVFQAQGDITLKSGTVESKADDIFYKLSSGTLSIQGGNVIVAEGNAIVSDYDADSVNITGGTFSVLPSEDSIESGYAVVRIGTGYQALPTSQLENGIAHGATIATQVDGIYYASLEKAITAAMNGTNKTITLLSDIAVDSWNMIWNITGITLDGDGHTIKVNDIQSGQNHDAVFHSAGNNIFKNLTVDLSGIATGSQAQGYRAFSAAPGDVFEKITVIGNGHVSYGITVGGSDAADETITIDGCTFNDLGYAVYDSENVNVENLIIKNSTMTNCDYATILRSENGQFIDNTVSGGKLNIMTDKQTVTGNVFTDGSRIKFYAQPAAFEKNNISSDSKLAANSGVTGIDVSENYWGGGEPSADQLNGVDVTGNDVYYTEDTMKPEDLNTYRPSTGGGAHHPDAGGSTSSSDRYDIDKPSKVENGSIKVSDSRAEKGDTVTITVTPDEGYELDELVVYDKDGDKIDLKDKGDGKYTFEMPKGDVEIEVSFAAISDETLKANFTDVAADAWYADAVQYVYENGLMSGTSETTFSPDLTTTRGMIVTILYRMENEPAVTGTTAFTDVAADQYYANAVAWAAQNGIVAGIDATTFAPDKAITREQMAAILYRYAQFKGYDVSAKADLSIYTDAASVGAYAVDAMAWANGAGLITGTSATTLTPAGNATRAQVAAILMRFGENIAK